MDMTVPNDASVTSDIISSVPVDKRGVSDTTAEETNRLCGQRRWERQLVRSSRSSKSQEG